MDHLLYRESLWIIISQGRTRHVHSSG